MSHQNHLRNPKYRHWVKAGLGLKYVKEGLVGFVDDILKQQQRTILTTLNTSASSCNQCTLQNLLPLHAQGNRGKNKQCPLRLTRCNCLYSPKGLRKCPNSICDTLYDSIVIQHASNPPEPNWKNSNINDWSQNHWEIGKCYIYATGYAMKTTGNEMDCSGLLHIIINNKEAHTHLNCNIKGNGQDIFAKVRQARNEILHSGTMELEKAEVDDYIDDMVALFSDKKELALRSDAIDAVKLLKKLKNENFAISTKDETEIIQDALSAIEAKKNEVLDEIEVKWQEKKTEIEGFQNSFKDTVREIDDIHKRILVLENKFTELSKKQTEDTDDLKKQLSGVKKDIDKLAETKTEHNKRLEYLKRKRDIQSHLIKLYSEHYTKVSASPLMPSENDTDVIDLYVTPKIKVCNDQEQLKETGHNQITYVKSYRDIFEKDGQRVKNVYISGEAGIGKSTFCKEMIRKWCIAHSDVTDDDNDVKVMKEFDFLFFVSLRHAGGNEHVHDMVIKQLMDGCGTIIAEIFENEDDKCLILLDGLDEWTSTVELCDLKPIENPDLPRRDLMKNYTVVTTTRPLRLASVDMKKSDITHHIQILGLNIFSMPVMIKNIVAQLNKKFKRSRKADEFITQLRKTHLLKTDIPKIPIMIQQLICIWHDGNSILQSTYSKIFCCMLDLMFRRAEMREQRDSTLMSLKLDTMDQLKKKADEEGINNFELPTNLRLYDKCIEYKFMIYFFGKFAFNSFYSRNQDQLVFNRARLNNAGISKTELQFALHVGLLTEERMKGVAAAVSPNTTITFIHKTFQELFAACYVAIRALKTAYARKSYVWFGAVKCRQSRETNELISQLTSETTDLKLFLNNSSMVTLLCGLHPPLCALIYNTIYHRFSLESKATYTSFQNLVFECINECVSSEENFPEECIKLTFFIIENQPQSSLIRYIDLASVHYAIINWKTLHELKLEKSIEHSAKCGNLWKLEIDASFCSSHEITALEQVLVECSDSSVELTLTSVALYTCAKVTTVLPNMAILRVLCLKYVSLSTTQINSLNAFFTNSRHLSEVKLSCVTHCDSASFFRDDIDAPGPVKMDLSNLSRLENVSLDQSYIIFSKLNTRILQTYALKMLQPEILTENIKCIRGAKDLRYLSIDNHPTYCLTYFGQTCLVWDTLQEIIETLPNLKTLNISGYVNSALSFTTLKSLETVKYSNIRLKNNEIWYKSVGSLARMQHSVSVEVFIFSGKGDLLEFVEKNAKFHVTEVSDHRFKFKTLK